MKKLKLAIPFIVFLLFTVCGSGLTLPDDPVVFEIKDNGDYMSVIWGNKEYVPYCASESSQIGDCLGYYENSGSKVYVRKLKGQSENEWLADVLGLDNCDEGMIYREINTLSIPNELSSDYSWNR